MSIEIKSHSGVQDGSYKVQLISKLISDVFPKGRMNHFIDASASLVLIKSNFDPAVNNVSDLLLMQKNQFFAENWINVRVNNGMGL